MLQCKTPELGGFVLEFPECSHSEFHFFTCKIRPCPSCGAKYSNNRVLKAQSIMINARHRHITFTIAEVNMGNFTIEKKLDHFTNSVSSIFGPFLIYHKH